MKRLAIITFALIQLLCLQPEIAAQEYEFKTDQDIIVVGDIHGAYSELTTSLQKLNVIDSDLNWQAGKKHFVSLGDMLDRGADSRKVMDLLIKLQQQATKAGGQVHIVLGNHEVMNIIGDLRYVSDGEFAAFADEETSQQRKQAYKHFLDVYRARDSKNIRAQFDERFPPGYFALTNTFRPNGKYGRWLLSLPYVIKINEQVFLHGGLSDAVEGKSLVDLNNELSGALNRYLNSWEKIRNNPKLFYPQYKQRYKLVKKLGKGRENKMFLKTEDSLLFSQKGPTWYRGNALCHPLYETDILFNILTSLGAKRAWVGHTVTFNNKPLTRLDDQLVIMDTGMLKKYYGGKPYLAVIANSGKYQLYHGNTGKAYQAKQAPARESANPFGLSDKQMKVVLKNAKVVKVSGKAKKAQTVTLNYDGHEFKAKFFSLDKVPDLLNSQWDSDFESSKRYQHELAAHTLDRMLGIGLVPTTIEREIKGRKGALQVMIDNLISEATLLKKYNGQIGVCKRSDQQNMKYVFDYLVQNESSRKSQNYYSKKTGQVWFLSNEQAFNSSTRFTAKNRPETVFVTAAFKKALLGLEKSDLDKLAAWLHPKQIDAIWERRKRLLDNN